MELKGEKKMKRILTFLMTMCLVLGLCAALTSCGHECAFSTDWSKDATHHWHACTVEEGCNKVADKAEHSGGFYKSDDTSHWGVCTVCGAEHSKTSHVYTSDCDTTCNDCGAVRTAKEHTWDEGVVTSEASHSKDGEKKFTCTACAETKTETVEFTGISFEEWYAAFDLSNFTYTEVAKVSGPGVTSEVASIYKFLSYKVYVKIGTVGGETEEIVIGTKADVDELRNELIASMKDIAWHKRFAFDGETRTYKATMPIRIAAAEEYTRDVSIKFDDNNNLVEIKYSVEFEVIGNVFTLDTTITVSDHGTTTLD